MDTGPITDDARMLLPPRIYGYSLLDHRWLALDINCLSDMSTISGQKSRPKLEDLVLPYGHKTILQALITNQFRVPSKEPGNLTDDFSMDVVPAKGNGLIILLHGAPGVGKTSTAECIATELNRPLLPITCGDIGTTAREAEENLESFCTLAHRWKCVLLLDEADVFLAKRERGDIKRNSLVSVFLRVLEYFSGVIILTTNRVGEFDEAFRSRIHMCLYYPRLRIKQSRKIWEKHIQRIKNSDLGIDIEEEEIKGFADEVWEMNHKKPTRLWNGRQIKNAFQTAIALARWDFYEENDASKLKQPLVKLKHFKHVAAIAAHFDEYVSEIHGIDGEDTWGTLAERDGLRKDSIQSRSHSAQSDVDRRRRGHPSHVETYRRGKDKCDSFGSQDEDDADELADTELDSGEEFESVSKLERELKRRRKKQKGKNKTPW